MTRLHTLLLVIATLFVTVGPAFALEPNKDGYFHTGDAVRTKSIGPFTAKVYAIRHDMKQLPSPKSKQAVIDADVDKKFTWMMLRDVSSSKIQNALREAFQMNGYGDGGKIGQFVGAFNKDEIKEKDIVSISYKADTKTTTIWVKGMGSASIAGADFMKAVWKIWFGKIDQPSMGDQLISKF
ncbi:MAG: chalcone isomerase family protein [Myxococcales bacterium]|nr:chalcone isomerase family protein [Myxococcales bacterium]